MRRVDRHDNGRVGAHTGSLVRMSLDARSYLLGHLLFFRNFHSPCSWLSLLHLAELKVLRPLLFEYHSQVALEARKIRRTSQNR